MTDWKLGDRVRIIGDRPTGGKEGTIVGGFENTALVKLDTRFKTRRVYDYRSDEFEVVQISEKTKVEMKMNKMTNEELTADIQDKIAEVLSDLDDKKPLPDKSIIYVLLTQAAGAIDRLDRENHRLLKANVDMGWELNPDRMGGQFTEEEKNRSGWL